jgi:hypothetical protein
MAISNLQLVIVAGILPGVPFTPEQVDGLRKKTARISEMADEIMVLTDDIPQTS